MNYGDMNEVPNIHFVFVFLSSTDSTCSVWWIWAWGFLFGPRRVLGSVLGYRVAACSPSSLWQSSLIKLSLTLHTQPSVLPLLTDLPQHMWDSDQGAAILLSSHCFGLLRHYRQVVLRPLVPERPCPSALATRSELPLTLTVAQTYSPNTRCVLPEQVLIRFLGPTPANDATVSFALELWHQEFFGVNPLSIQANKGL